jgi:hypothetical protein
MTSDGNVLIELVEFDLDSVPRDTIKKAIPTIQNTIQSPTKDKKDENNTKMVNNSMVKIPTKDSSVNKFGEFDRSNFVTLEWFINRSLN